MSNPLFFSTTLVLSILSGVMSLVYAQDPYAANNPAAQDNNQQQQQQQLQQQGYVPVNPEEFPLEEIEETTGGYYSPSYNSAAPTGEDASAAMIEQMNQSTTAGNSTPVVGDSTTPEEGPYVPLTHSYPTFTDAEMNELFNVANVSSDENALDVEPIPEEDQTDFLYLEDTVQAYRSNIVNPVYTYGTDESGEGVCMADAEFCAKSAYMFDEIEKKYANGKEEIVESHGENMGLIIPPKEYLESAENMPRVMANKCPDGFTEYGEEGNPAQGEMGAHCGRVGGPNDNLYFRRPAP